MKNKGIVVLVSVLISTISLSQGTTQIIGKMKKGKGQMVYLQAFMNNKLTVIDSSKVNFLGKYKLKTEVTEHDFYSLTTDNKTHVQLILKGNEKIKLKTEKGFSNFDYSIKGSKDSKLLQKYLEMKNTKDITKDSISNYAVKFIEKNSKSLAVFIALRDINNPKKSLEAATKGIGESYPDSRYHKGLKAALVQMSQTPVASKPKPSAVGIGSIAPELNMVSPEGKIITLESLRGKYVLIDFWASWCGPCRRENPNVVNLYKAYKDKGFDVYSVSLDKDKSRWEAAIKKDNLIWSNHVSDLRGWSSAACPIYGFRGIPYTVLIDPEGKVIATRLRGPALANKLKEIFDK